MKSRTSSGSLSRFLRTPAAALAAWVFGAATAVACYIPMVKDCPPTAFLGGETCTLADDTPNYPFVRYAPPGSWGWTSFFTTGALGCSYWCQRAAQWYDAYTIAYVTGDRCRRQN